MHEELLAKHADTDLKVYAIWFSMYPTDLRERWPSDVLTDPRVEHYWDEQKAVGRWYMGRVDEIKGAMASGSRGVSGDVLWDAYLVYGPDARWEEAPTGLRRWGRTILGTQDALREAFAAVVGPSK